MGDPTPTRPTDEIVRQIEKSDNLGYCTGLDRAEVLRILRKVRRQESVKTKKRPKKTEKGDRE